MRRAPIFWLAALALLFVVYPGSGLIAAEENVEETASLADYVRLKRDDDSQPIALETATVRFSPADDEEQIVDLISAIHVGDRSYYDALNEHFQEYDVLLFEMVRPENPEPLRARRSGGGNLISQTQKMMKGMLGLELQTDIIDYEAENFVHADITQERLSELINEQEGGPIAMFAAVLNEAFQNMATQQSAGTDGEPAPPQLTLIEMLLDPNGSLKMKRAMAHELARTEGTMAMLPTLNRVLVTERNKAAMEALDRELERGTKKIGIFYGAAHMPDFEQRLVDDYDMQRGDTTWTQAWQMETASNETVFQGLLRSLSE